VSTENTPEGEAPEASKGAEGNAGGPDKNADAASSRKSEAPAGVESESSPEQALAAEVARLKDQLLRMAADFDNYRKRTRRDVQDAERRAQEDIVKALLPTFDNLERASAHTESAADLKGLVNGLQMVQRQFRDALAGLGIERVGEPGAAFDPAEHEAVQNVETSEYPPGAVAQVLQSGYRWKGRLVRPALVVVARAPSNGSGQVH
jgi:molecular chaperone GrpE